MQRGSCLQITFGQKRAVHFQFLICLHKLLLIILYHEYKLLLLMTGKTIPTHQPKKVKSKTFRVIS